MDNDINFYFHESGHHTKRCDTTKLPVGEWSKVIFAQYEDNGTFYRKLTINGYELEGENSCDAITVNTDPKTWENVQVREEMKINNLIFKNLSKFLKICAQMKI